MDKFDDTVSILSPITEKINYSKYKKNNGESIYLRIRVPGSTLNTGCKGVTLLLKSGERINWSDEPVDTDYDSYNNSWTYTSFTILDNEMIEKLIDDPITDVKLYIYKSSIGNPDIYSTYLNCVLEMN